MTDPSAAVVRLTLRKGDCELAVGSGVLYRRPNDMCIATAWHNLSGRHSETLRALSSTGAFPDNVVCLISQRAFNSQHRGRVRTPFRINLEDEDRAHYLVHPVGYPRVDVAVIPLSLDQVYPSEYIMPDGEVVVWERTVVSDPGGSSLGFDISSIQDCEDPLRWTRVDFGKLAGPGDELFVLGYPMGISDAHGEPVWKRATVASPPERGWNGEARFLIDCASREGMSGAPAIIHSKYGDLRVGGVNYAPNGRAAILQGIYVGRAPSSNEFEAQIGSVWKREVIDQILDAGLYAPHSSLVETSLTEIREAIASQWPNAREDSEWPASPEDYARGVLGKGIYDRAFTGSILKHLNGSADPETVRSLVIEHAQRLLAG